MTDLVHLGIIGGTFDPIHVGHLGIAEAARSRFALDRVIFVPAAAPPHKGERSIAPAADRLAMVSLAIAGKPYFAASDIEMRREGPSYTIDTLDEISAANPASEDFLYRRGRQPFGTSSMASRERTRQALRFYNRHPPGKSISVSRATCRVFRQKGRRKALFGHPDGRAVRCERN